MRPADFHGPLRMVSAIRIRYRFRNKIKCMRRKIKRKNGTFFRPLRKAEAFPVSFPRDIRKMVALVRELHFPTPSLRTTDVSLRSSPAGFAEVCETSLSGDERGETSAVRRLSSTSYTIYIYFRRSTIKLPQLIDFTTYEKFIEKTCLIVLPF